MQSDNATIISDSRIYDASTDSWSQIYTDTNPTYRTYSQAFWLGDGMFIFGGQQIVNTFATGGYLYSWDGP